MSAAVGQAAVSRLASATKLRDESACIQVSFGTVAIQGPTDESKHMMERPCQLYNAGGRSPADSASSISPAAPSSGCSSPSRPSGYTMSPEGFSSAAASS